MQYGATFGFAQLLPDSDENALLVEFPYGAHSAVLLALEQIDWNPQDLHLRGVAANGTGARFHVREASGGAGREIVTLAHVQPLRSDRSMATMPTQTVYYRLADDGFVEVGRGDVYDPEDAPWDIPRAIEPFLDPEWVRKQRG